MTLMHHSSFLKGMLFAGICTAAVATSQGSETVMQSRSAAAVPAQNTKPMFPAPAAASAQGQRSAFATPSSMLFPQTNSVSRQPGGIVPNRQQQKASPFPRMAYSESNEQSYPSGSADYPSDVGFSPDEITVVFENDKSSNSSSSSLSSDSDDQISVDFNNEHIKQVLKYIAELYDLNIVIPENLEGSISLRLRNTTWQSTLEAALSPVGCTYVTYKNIIQVRRLEDMDKEPAQTESFLLKHSDAKKVAEELKDMVDSGAGGCITFNERSNILIVTERPKRIKTISELITKLDQPEKQVMIEAKFVEVNDNDTKALGINWGQGVTFGINSPDGKFREYERKRDTKALGQPMEITKTLTDKLTFTQTGLSAALSFQDSNNFMRVLSNPTVVTMNNVTAEISIGEKLPVPNYTYNEEQGRFTISGFEEKDAGISLKVTPKIQDEFITMKLEPKLMEDAGSVDFTVEGGSKISYPKIKEKSVSSTVTIRSGYTIAIGGMISDKVQKEISKTPGLSSLPILGLLFSNKKNVNTLSNLLIFLTATQIAYDGHRVYDTPFYGVKNGNPEQMHKMGITDNQLPGYRYSPQEEARFDDVQRLRSKVETALMNKSLNQSAVEAKEAADKVDVNGDVTLKAKTKRRGRRS